MILCKCQFSFTIISLYMAFFLLIPSCRKHDLPVRDAGKPVPEVFSLMFDIPSDAKVVDGWRVWRDGKSILAIAGNVIACDENNDGVADYEFVYDGTTSLYRWTDSDGDRRYDTVLVDINGVESLVARIDEPARIMPEEETNGDGEEKKA